MLTTHIGDGGLGLVQRPVGGQVAAVLVAIGIADHDHLLVAARAEVAAVDVQAKELGQDARGGLQVIDRLKQRHDR